jgi:hypothetical protein
MILKLKFRKSGMHRFSVLIDNYQYLMCKICQSLGKEDEDWKKYNAIRASMINLLTSYQGILIAFKNDPDSQKARLNDIFGKLQDYVLLANREILPNITEIESKTTISKGDILKVSSKTVSKAIDLGGLDEMQVNEFVEKLKLE